MSKQRLTKDDRQDSAMMGALGNPKNRETQTGLQEQFDVNCQLGEVLIRLKYPGPKSDLVQPFATISNGHPRN